MKQSSAGYGEQSAAERIVHLNPRLALTPGDLIDCTGRSYKNITALQYAVWALDYHMWNMILKYINRNKLEEIARTQLKELPAPEDDKGFITQDNRWPSLSWQPLIEAYNKYLNEGYSTEVWQKQVGGAQLLLPAHVINEYSHPDRAKGFKDCKWGSNDEGILPRVGVIDWKSVENGKYILGKNFAWGRGGWGARDWLEGNGNNYYAELDVRAVAELMKARGEHARMLLKIFPTFKIYCYIKLILKQLKNYNFY